MHSPTVDIIVPVWNSPNEARECLASVLSYSPEARLIIVENGSSRQTQLMLDEFSEALGDNALIISSERNVGLVRAINIGLARSDSDYAIILRPHVTVTAGWLSGLLEAARTGIASPLFSGSGAPRNCQSGYRCDLLETRNISFSTLALSGETRMLSGFFDEQMDGGEWCLKDYISRAWSRGYRTCVTSSSNVVCKSDPILGSLTRRQELAARSKSCYQERWGANHHYLIYFGDQPEPGSLVDKIETILNGCRQGHRFTLLLHHRQMVLFRRMGWNRLHTSLQLRNLSRFMPQRDLRRNMVALKTEFPDLVLIPGAEGVVFPGSEPCISFRDIEVALFSPETLYSQT